MISRAWSRCSSCSCRASDAGDSCPELPPLAAAACSCASDALAEAAAAALLLELLPAPEAAAPAPGTPLIVEQYGHLTWCSWPGCVVVKMPWQL